MVSIDASVDNSDGHPSDRERDGFDVDDADYGRVATPSYLRASETAALDDFIGSEVSTIKEEGTLSTSSATWSHALRRRINTTTRKGVNKAVLQGSALSKTRFVQAVIYALALAGVVFVLIAQATHLGAKDGESQGGATNDPHRRLGGGASPLLVHIAFCVLGAGTIAFMVYMLNQPLILGYLLGGVLIGPIGLKIVKSHEDIATLSSLGLIFLLFMVGLELNVRELLKMGRLVLLTGALQFPICAGIQIAIFSGLQAVGLNFGKGDYAALYCGMSCAISSTMIVCKTLAEMNDTSSPPGRLTIGILIFQDIWAIIVLAIQPNMANPEVTGILKTFAFIIALIGVALLYAKFVMPAVLFFASKSLEMMLVLSLTWCFFICCIAVLPFLGLGMELASLIAGVALATFPYSAELNGKIKHIRDFFITLFFVSLGMQIPTPTIEAILMAVLIAAVVLVFRWLGIYCMVRTLRGPAMLATLATLNLSQVSEFALVICSLGLGYGHVQEDTMTIIIWTFAVLAIMSTYVIGKNRVIYRFLAGIFNRLLGRGVTGGDDAIEGKQEEHRDIVLLGFHRIGAMLIANFAEQDPELLKRVHIVDGNADIARVMKDKSVKVSYADIGAPDVLEHTHHGMPRLVISTIPDSLLTGINNTKMLRNMQEVWPDAQHVVTADTRRSALQMYAAGASYVLRVEQLCAAKLHHLVVESVTEAGEADTGVFAKEKSADMQYKRGATGILEAV
mmetsp:Transcript_137204/g.273831  ORF Transcript_137204/g.273831 Transcript_137204/m.273831 type:complete len:735 (-) Transcript_137204:239-2443(-)